MSSSVRAVLFDFSGTLFHVEPAAAALTAAIGDAALAGELERFGAINGSSTPDELPPHLAEVWADRDLSRGNHRAAYSGMGRHAGLTADQANRVYERGLSAAAWQPYPDTIDVLQALHDAGIPVALVSNIGWDPRPVLQFHGAADLFDVLVLSDERGVTKPDPAIFRMACAELGVEPSDALMVGDNAQADGGATAVGCRFVLVPAAADRPADTLRRAVATVSVVPSPRRTGPA